MPFLIGATRSPIGDIRNPSADYSDLCDLLQSIQKDTPYGYYIGIAKCTALKVPVAAIYEGVKPVSESYFEQIETGSLYASRTYQMKKSMDVLVEYLWGLIRDDISIGHFSFAEGDYTTFSKCDLDFIQKARDAI